MQIPPLDESKKSVERAGKAGFWEGSLPEETFPRLWNGTLWMASIQEWLRYAEGKLEVEPCKRVYFFLGDSIPESCIEAVGMNSHFNPCCSGTLERLRRQHWEGQLRYRKTVPSTSPPLIISWQEYSRRNETNARQQQKDMTYLSDDPDVEGGWESRFLRGNSVDLSTSKPTCASRASTRALSLTSTFSTHSISRFNSGQCP